MKLSKHPVSLRGLDSADVGALYSLVCENDLSRLTTPYWHPWSRADIGALVDRKVVESDRVTLGLDIAGHGLVGLVELHDMNVRTGVAELGITIFPPEQRGHGIGTIASTLMCDWAFAELRLRRIQAKTPVTNETSVRLFQRLGFTPEARWRDYFQLGGETVDAQWFGLLRDEWHQDSGQNPER